ncbi:MAG: hypothetical protein ACFFG0_03360 [Candidatus Thorarchaeota archaeon]
MATPINKDLSYNKTRNLIQDIFKQDILGRPSYRYMFHFYIERIETQEEFDRLYDKVVEDLKEWGDEANKQL